MNARNKKVLVTGACGFIGSHLVERLLEDGCDVRAFVFYNSFNSWGWLDTLDRDILKKIEVFPGDIRDVYRVRQAVRGRDIIFHLAALVGIPFSYYSPASYIDTNVKGTLNILEAARDYAAQKVIVTSTSEVYGTARYVPIDENHALQGQSPYAASKIAADKLALSFFHSFDTPVVIARPFNTYGPRQSLRAIIPTIITQLLSDNMEVELGALHPTRDFNYIKDVCDGFVDIAQSDKVIGQEFNIASSTEISIGKLAQMIIKNINPQARIKYKRERVRPQKSEVERLSGSSAKIKKVTRWNPRYSLKEGLEQTIDWFRAQDIQRLYKPQLYNV